MYLTQRKINQWQSSYFKILSSHTQGQTKWFVLLFFCYFIFIFNRFQKISRGFFDILVFLVLSMSGLTRFDLFVFHSVTIWVKKNILINRWQITRTVFVSSPFRMDLSKEKGNQLNPILYPVLENITQDIFILWSLF